MTQVAARDNAYTPQGFSARASPSARGPGRACRPGREERGAGRGTSEVNMVIASGVNPKEAQPPARHATAELTIGLYGRVTDQRLAQAIDQIAQHVICMAPAGEDQTQAVEIPEESRMPKGGFEPPRLVRHHPLKMACLPIPPLRQAGVLNARA